MTRQAPAQYVLPPLNLDHRPFNRKLGKLGSALHHPGTPVIPGWPETWPDPFRSVVLLSRMPATAVAAFALAAGLTGADTRELLPALLGPGILMICNLLWAKADLLLLQAAE